MSSKALGVAVIALVVAAWIPPATASTADGWHWEPHLGFASGDHHVDFPLDFRYRYEGWSAFVDDWSGFHAIRTRFGLDYRFRDRLRLFAQGQQMAVPGLSADSSGAEVVYWLSNGGETDPSTVVLSQLFVEFDITQEISVLLGRSYVNMGTGVVYDQPGWSYLKKKRISQRLLGSVDWTHGARAYDGGAVDAEFGGHHLNLMVFQPTTGVFVVDDEAYEHQDDIWVGGVDWTAPPGTLLDNAEFGAFFLVYFDVRDPDEVAGLFGDIQTYTLGGHWLGVYSFGSGRVDMLVWGALQLGKYADQGPTSGVRDRDQLAGAVVAEVGYQLPDLPGKPWLRTGVNWGSGDGDRDDDDRHTFFNILPTNHMYYGFLDQFALQNLLDVFVQLRLDPIPKVGVELTYHRFWLHEENDFRWVGTGAFSREGLGYLGTPSNGSDDAGDELDLVLSYRPHPIVTVSAGFSYLWSGDVFAHLADPNAAFGWAQLGIRY